MADLTLLRGLIAVAVREAVNRGGHTAVLLSGGIDSSTVAVHAHELPVVTGFYEGEAYDERPWARLIGDDRDWLQVEIAPDDFVDNFDAVVAATGPPWEGPGALGQFMVAKHCRAEGFDRLLSGEGGDELFGGYARVMIVAGRKPPQGYEDYVLPEGYPSELGDALELEWDHLGMLIDLDAKICSAHGIYCEAPLTDARIVDYVLRQPSRERVGKDMLRAAMQGIVPKKILSRKDKRGFPVPFVDWAQEDPVRGFVEARIGYLPDPAQPWDRQWWNDMCDAAVAVEA